jgi:hypothetical protein
MSDELHSFISDVLHQHGLLDRDAFALRAAKALMRLEAWDDQKVKAAVGRVRTDLYRRHLSWPRNQVLELIASRVARRWKVRPIDEDEKGSSTMIKILFLGSNPTFELSPGISETPLALDEELREIQNKIRASKHRDSLQLVSRLAARPDDLIQALNEIQPHIVHFSGHGTGTEELVLLNDQRQPQTVSKSAIEALFKTMRDKIRVVMLNACFSKVQAAAIRKHVDCAIGMEREIGDDAAITFAASFYRAIGFGRSVKEGFEQGLAALMLAGIPENLTPILLCRKGINPANVKLLDS